MDKQAAEKPEDFFRRLMKGYKVGDKFITLYCKKIAKTGELPDPLILGINLKSMDSGYSDNRSIEFVMEGYANELKMYLEQMEASLWPAQWPYPHTIGIPGEGMLHKGRANPFPRQDKDGTLPERWKMVTVFMPSNMHRLITRVVEEDDLFYETYNEFITDAVRGKLHKLMPLMRP